MMRRSGWKHWLFTGLALVSSAANVHGQTGSPYGPGAFNGGAPGPGMPGGNPGGMSRQDIYGMGNNGPAHYAVPGPPPGEIGYYDDPTAAGPGVVPAGFAHRPGVGGAPCSCCTDACDTSPSGPYGAGMLGCAGGQCGDGLCTDCGGTGCLFCGGAGCQYCGGGANGCRLCGSYGGRLGLAPVRNLIRSTGLGANSISQDGCMSCGWGNGCILPGRFCGLLGKLAPYSEGGSGQRLFDVYLGTMALSRTDTQPATVVTTQGISGTPVLRLSDPSIDELKFGLAMTAVLQLGPGGSLEATYFGLNKWDTTATATSPVNADLYSVFSDFGVSPPGGFDDTDRSISQSVNYKSQINNGEVNFRRRIVAPQRFIQGSWLAGVRYFDLDETFGFQAVGLTNNGLNQTQRFFNLNTATRNELTGFQVGGDLWLNVVPGLAVGFEGKSGVYGNHSEVESTVLANSVNLSQEQLSSGDTAYLNQFQLMGVYRLSYSWAFRGSYNWMKVDNVALAPRNFNASGLVPDPNGLVFGPGRNSFLDVNGNAKFSGFSLGAEYLW